MSKRYTLAERIQQFQDVHGALYDYSNITEYKDAKTKMEILCKRCDLKPFYISANTHLRGVGCRVCGYKKAAKSIAKTQEWFLDRAAQKHGDKYDYSDANYKKATQPVLIHCNCCGDSFSQTPNNHINNGTGCPSCGKKNNHKAITHTTDQFLSKAKAAGLFEKFDFKNVVYRNSHTPVDLSCKECGHEWKIRPSNLLSGKGCPKCKNARISRLRSLRPNGWRWSHWKSAGERSKNFDGFKFYHIRCQDRFTGEVFEKVGKTFLSVEARFKYDKDMPYDFHVINTVEGDAREISELENLIKAEIGNFAYLPSKSFAGMQECYLPKTIKDSSRHDSNGYNCAKVNIQNTECLQYEIHFEFPGGNESTGMRRY